jgi:hypothetical protein
MREAELFARQFVQLWLDRRFDEAYSLMDAADQSTTSSEEFGEIWTSSLEGSDDPPLCRWR